MAGNRKLPRNARPARRRLAGGGTADGYIQSGTFVPFDDYSAADFSGGAYLDNSVPCDNSTTEYGSSGSSSDSGSSGGGYSYDSGSSSSSSYDSGSSSYDSGSSSY